MYSINNYLANPTHDIKIAMVGVGGTGSFILPELAALSNTLKILDRKPLNITVFDPDIVEPHNVNKQKFHEADIGGYKANILTNRVNRAYGSDIKSENRLFDTIDVNNGFNIIITAVDDLKTRKYIDQAIKRKDLRNNNSSDYCYLFHWIDCGNSRDYGQVIMSAHENKRELLTIIDLHPNMVEDKNEPSCSLRESLSQQSFTVNKMTGIIAIELLSSLLLDFNIKHSEVYFSLNPMNIKTNKL